MQDFEFKTPPKVIERSQQFYDLIETKSVNGMIPAQLVAEYYGISYTTFCAMATRGKVPFAFVGGAERKSLVYISNLPWFYFEMQR